MAGSSGDTTIASTFVEGICKKDIECLCYEKHGVQTFGT